MPHLGIITSYDLGPFGAIQLVSAPTDSATGAEVSITVPGSAVWEVYALHTTIDTDATATGRRPRLLLDDGENIFARHTAVNQVDQNEVHPITWGRGLVADADGSDRETMALLGGLIMLPGWRIRTETTGLQAGDDYRETVLYVREIPQRGVEVGQEALRSALRRLISEEGLGG